MICWLLLVPAGVPVLSPFFSLLSFLRTGFRSIMICWFLLVPAGVLVSFLFFLSSGKGFCSIMIYSLFGLGFRCLSPFFSLFFLRKGLLFHHGFPGSSCFGLGFRCLSPFFSLLSFLNRSVPDSSMNFELHMTLVETCVVYAGVIYVFISILQTYTYTCDIYIYI